MCTNFPLKWIFSFKNKKSVIFRTAKNIVCFVSYNNLWWLNYVQNVSKTLWLSGV